MKTILKKFHYAWENYVLTDEQGNREFSNREVAMCAIGCVVFIIILGIAGTIEKGGLL